MRLTELGKGWLPLPSTVRNLEATGISCDSRRVRPGDLFVAVRGGKADGHQYIAEAVRAGAVAVVGEGSLDASAWRIPFISVRDSREALGRLSAAFYRHPSRDLCVCGVTGTKGKTTTSWLLASIFEALELPTGLFGTIHNRVLGESLPSENTTPGPLELEAQLRRLLDGGGSHVAMEVSSHGIAQNRIAGIEFRVGIFTNIAPEHLDYHGTMEHYFATKASFFAGLGAKAFAVLPRDDRAAQAIAAATAAKVVWYGSTLRDGVERIGGVKEGLEFLWKGTRVRSPLWSDHNLLNLLAAMSAAEALGLERAAIARAVEGAVAPPGRLEEVENEIGIRIFVDYAHTEGSLETVLKAVRAVTPGRVIVVFGCGGDRDRQKRPRMGRAAERLADRIIVTSDNPRSEEPQAIIDEICGGLEQAFQALVVPDRREAIGLSILMAKPGDTVLIAGKGHETYQEIRGKKHHFDDREEARAALDRRARCQEE